jgi:hypothetical protein
MTTDSALCSEWSTVSAVDASRAWQVRYAVNNLTTAGCRVDGTLQVAVNATSAGLPEVIVSGAEFDLPGPNDTRTWEYRGGAIVPADADQTRNVQWTITWAAPQTSGLETVSGTTQTTAVGCTPTS